MRKSIFITVVLLSCMSNAWAKPTGFLLFGDSGTGKKKQYKVAAGMERYCNQALCEFVVLLGDNFYPSGVKSVVDKQWNEKHWQPYEALKLAFYPILGNHDYAGNIAAQIEYSAKDSRWKMPARYYRFHHEGIDFFAIDTNRFDAQQAKWLDYYLNQSRAQWRIVYGHHPIFSYGNHGHSKQLIKALWPIIKDRAEFYFSGHDHDKQVLQLNSNYFVVSGASAQTEETHSGRLTLYADDKLGFAHLHIDGRNAVLRMLNKKGETDYSRAIRR